MKKGQIHNAGSIWKHHFPRHQLLAAFGISAAMVAALSILPDSVIANRSSLLMTDTAPKSAAEPILAPALPKEESTKDPWLHFTVKKGDTLSSLLQESGLGINDVHAIANNNAYAKELASLKLGDELDVLIKNGTVQELELHRSKLEKVSVSREGDAYKAELISRKPEIKQGFAKGTIDSSLFLAAQKAGLDDRMTLKLADIFAYDIDFMLDIQEGDSFSVIYEDLYLDGEHIGKGKILAAEFTNNGKTYRAVNYTNKEGNSQYYTPQGDILRKQFLRTPVDFAKITSYFSLSRQHPILHKIRAHKGIDYGAPIGTPIRAAGDGVVVFAGVRNGFGNVVMIQHGGVYTTLYGHMSTIGVKNGARVSQGQVIGAVGMTGLATGPHLHYEFHVNGVAQNPLANSNVAMAEPLNKTEKVRFSEQTTQLLDQLTQRAATANKLQQLATNTEASGSSSKQ